MINDSAEALADSMESTKAMDYDGNNDYMNKEKKKKDKRKRCRKGRKKKQK